MRRVTPNQSVGISTFRACAQVSRTLHRCLLYQPVYPTGAFLPLVYIAFTMRKRRSSGDNGLAKRVQTEFGRRLKEARHSGVGRVPQEVLATALAVTRTSISNIENGRHRVFLDQVYAAAQSLKIPVAQLLPDEAEIALPQMSISGDADLGPSAKQQLTNIAESVVRKSRAR